MSGDAQHTAIRKISQYCDCITRAALTLRARTARPLSKSRRRIASDHATPLRNIQLLNVDDFLDDVVSCLHFPLIVQQRLSVQSDGDSDTLDQPHAGQIRD